MLERQPWVHTIWRAWHLVLLKLLFVRRRVNLHRTCLVWYEIYLKSLNLILHYMLFVLPALLHNLDLSSAELLLFTFNCYGVLMGHTRAIMAIIEIWLFWGWCPIVWCGVFGGRGMVVTLRIAKDLFLLLNFCFFKLCMTRVFNLGIFSINSMVDLIDHCSFWIFLAVL